MAISNPKKVAPFANGDLDGKMDQCIYILDKNDIPNQSGPKATSEGTNAFGSPNNPYAIQCRLVFLSCFRCETICLHPRFYHVYRVYYCPQLDDKEEHINTTVGTEMNEIYVLHSQPQRHTG